MLRINIAIIGCGEMGVLHAESLQKIPAANLYACCDLKERKSQSFAQRFRIRHVTSNPGEIFEDSKTDAIYITSTTDSHLSLFRHAAKSAKHILVEKPLALSAEHALEMYQISKQTPSIMMTAFKFRFYGMIQKAHQIMPDPFMISVHIIDDPWTQEFWANQPDKGGGNVVSQGVHGADLLRFLIGSEPEQVFGVANNYHQRTGVIDNLAATFRFKNGAAGNLMVGDCGTAPFVSKFMVQLSGKQGTITLVDRLTDLHLKPMNEKQINHFHGEEDGIFEENKIFIDAILGSEDDYPTIWDGFVAQAMIDAAIRSSQRNKAVSVLD
ncbi:MAG: Gfo/Idh/MocA family oxidoreductase [bacterium]|nr:MAG: Gfo/Idh/MocA family oxidoreductase [bacterium]